MVVLAELLAIEARAERIEASIVDDTGFLKQRTDRAARLIDPLR